MILVTLLLLFGDTAHDSGDAAYDYGDGDMILVTLLWPAHDSGDAAHDYSDAARHSGDTAILVTMVMILVTPLVIS